jgi:hypothetical protein
MIIDFHNEQDEERQGFTGKQPTFWEGATNLKWIGRKAMEHAAGGARAAALAGSVFFPKETVAREQDPGRILPRKEDFFRFIDNYIDPARAYWTPSPDEVGTAGKILGSVAGMALAGGPENITLNATMNTAADLIDQGVDPTTATTAGIGAGAVNYAMTGVPQTGKTLLGKAGLVLLNPLMGIGQDLALKKGLESRGYKEQAAGINPLDPVSRGTDLFIGGLFGGLAHFAQARERLPVEVIDSVDTVQNHEKAKAASPFKEGASPSLEEAHVEAYTKAMNDIHEGRPVDVSPVIKKRMTSEDAVIRDMDADALKAGDELRTAIEQGKSVSDAELKTLAQRAAGIHPAVKTEPSPETASLREFVGKEAAALDEELAREFTETPRARTAAPRQNVEPWHMSREELISTRDSLANWYDAQERTILGDRTREWRRAASRGDTAAMERIESQLKPEEVTVLHRADTQHNPQYFTHLVDTRERLAAGLALNGFSEHDLAAEMASSLTKLGNLDDPRSMTPSEREAYVTLDEALRIIHERGMDGAAITGEALRLTGSYFPDPSQGVRTLERFVTRRSEALPPSPLATEKQPSPPSEGEIATSGEPLSGEQGSGVRGSRGEASTADTHPQGMGEASAATHDELDTLASNVETLLSEHGDTPLVVHGADGQLTTVSARQALDEARAEMERTRQLEKAYQRAALCLGLD